MTVKKLPRRQRRAILGAVFALAGLVAIVVWDPGAVTPKDPLAGDGDVIEGEVAFNATCATCHGIEAVGTDQGPPLVHDYYRPGHHADGAFFAAVRIGVRQHHWPFGNMPPQDDLTDEDINNIVAYVRRIQVDAGIE